MKLAQSRWPHIIVVCLLLALAWSVAAFEISGCGGTIGADHAAPSISLGNSQDKIVYISDDMGTYDLWMITDLDYPDPQPVFVENDGDQHEPVWSPDGTAVAFISNHSSASFDLFIVEPPSQPPQRLTFTIGLNEKHPAWSRDGTKLVFVRERTGGGWDLYLIDRDGNNLHPLVETRYRVEYDPHWSSVDDRILFASRQLDGLAKTDIFWIDATTPQVPVNLTNTRDLDEREPRWSPDGSHILFTVSDALENRDIWVMDANGNNRQNLTPDAQASDEFNSRWSPDGTQVLFTSDRRNGRLDLFVMPATGGQAQRIEIPGPAGNNELEADWWGPQQETPTPGPSPTTTNTVPPTPTSTATSAATSTPTPTPTPHADLSNSQKQVNKGSALPGDTLTYTITLWNTGNLNAAGVTIIDTLPPEVQYADSLSATSGTPNWNELSKQVTWTGSVEVGVPVDITFRVRVMPAREGTVIRNVANVVHSSGDQTLSTDTVVGGVEVSVPLVVRNWDWCLGADISEPNNTTSTARGPLCPDHSYQAYIETDEDQDDIYWIWVSSAGTLIVDLKSIPLGTDYDLAVYDEAVTKIGESASAGNAEERVEATVSPGKYYIRVHRFQGSSVLDPYELTWRLQ